GDWQAEDAELGVLDDQLVAVETQVVGDGSAGGELHRRMAGILLHVVEDDRRQTAFAVDRADAEDDRVHHSRVVGDLGYLALQQIAGDDHPAPTGRKLVSRSAVDGTIEDAGDAAER